MKLYAFKPNGSASFFTIAKNEVKARKVVNKYIEDNYLKNELLDYRANGWGSVLAVRSFLSHKTI